MCDTTVSCAWGAHFRQVQWYQRRRFSGFSAAASVVLAPLLQTAVVPCHVMAGAFITFTSPVQSTGQFCDQFDVTTGAVSAEQNEPTSDDEDDDDSLSEPLWMKDRA